MELAIASAAQLSSALPSTGLIALHEASFAQPCVLGVSDKGCGGELAVFNVIGSAIVCM